jgi:dipeptidyl aminopeptidase/acylaminoacyl peptidase
VLDVALPPPRVRSTSGGVLAWAGENRLLHVAAGGRLAADELGVPAGPAGPAGSAGPGSTADRFPAVEGVLSAPTVAPDAVHVAFVADTADACAVVVARLDEAEPPRRVSDADWAWDPAWSADGRLAWHEWDFPAMSWDASRIVVADPADGFARPRVVAGGDAVAVGQPRFAPSGGALAYVSDEGGWWNVWVDPDPRDGPGRGRWPVLDEPFEHAEPAWEVGQRSFAWSPTGDAIALCRNEAGFGRLVIATLAGAATEVENGWHHAVDWGPAGILAVRSGARTAPAVTLTTGVGGATGAGRRVLDGGPPAGLDRAALREPEPVEWTAPDGATVSGLLWRRADGVSGGPGAPLLVDVHGGPTGQATVAWNLRIQYLVSRGWTVLQPNPRGSTGSGRAYMQALTGRWGELDVEDVAAGIRAAPARGWGGAARVAVLGGSSGGMLALLVCARHPSLVRAAVTPYPVTDLVDLAATTHRFEAHYSDGLVGPLPEAEAIYRNRSPATHAARIRTPLLVLQGDADVVVSPAQVERFVADVRAAGGSVEFHRYEGEGHGWSRPETVLDALDRTEAFLVRHLGAP